MKLALKVDVTTPRGAREGVPRLAALLTEHDAGATFFFCVGSRRAAWRRFLPANDAWRRLGAVLRDVRAAGFDTGVQAPDAQAWRRQIGQATIAWTEAQMRLAIDRYAEA